MKKENGFTLLELLAVIIILAMILLIATPIVLNILSDSKKSTFERSVNHLISTADDYYASNQLEINDTIVFDFTNRNGQGANGEELDFSGVAPRDGKLILYKNGDIAVALSNGTYCGMQQLTDSKVTILEDIDNCSIEE